MMVTPQMFSARSVTPDVAILPAYFPVPTLGLIPINAFLIRAAQPVLVDTGFGAVRDEFMQQLASSIAIEDIRWIYLTHVDPDHVGSLEQILSAAPEARVVTTFIGMGKRALALPLPPQRVYLLNPGQSLDVGDRRLVAFKPPSFDAPETTGLLDTKTGVLFSSDSFGAVMAEPAESTAAMSPSALRDGLVTWATVDAPWLSVVDEKAFERSLQAVRSLSPGMVLSSHLPPAQGMLDTLLGHLRAACTATPYVGPDQAALLRLVSAA